MCEVHSSIDVYIYFLKCSGYVRSHQCSILHNQIQYRQVNRRFQSRLSVCSQGASLSHDALRQAGRKSTPSFWVEKSGRKEHPRRTRQGKAPSVFWVERSDNKEHPRRTRQEALVRREGPPLPSRPQPRLGKDPPPPPSTLPTPDRRNSNAELEGARFWVLRILVPPREEQEIK